MKFKNGCYIGAYFVKNEAFDLFYSNFDARMLFFRVDMNKKYDVESFRLPDDPPHITLMYSNDIPTKEPVVKEFAYTDMINPTFLGLDIFPYGDELSIVALLDSVVIHGMHNRIKSLYGLTPTYPDYKPHLTLFTFPKEYELFVRESLPKASRMIKDEWYNLKPQPLKMTFKIEDLDPK